MKDENNDAIITEFVELRAKIYALCVDDKKDTKKAEGIKNNIIARSIIQWHNWNDAQAVVHKIKIARSVHHIWNENSSESIRW